MTETIDRLQRALGDRYSIERELGQGGMATVYLARDVKHERPVAIKVLRPELAAVLGRDRFLQEIKVTANLQHPHILTLHDSGEADDLLYYVMPYVEGETLRDRLQRETTLSVDEAVKISVTVANALDYAHRRGVIHRDVKPENVLLHDGEAIVADFGVALALVEAGGNRLTTTGLSLGTPCYMSPEQAAADPDIDERSDIYALGCMLYEMLAGEPPFGGNTAPAVLARIMADTPPPIRATESSVPKPLVAAIEKALAKSREDRFTTAADFVRAVSTATGDASTTTPIGWVTKRRIAIAGTAVALVMVFTGIQMVRGAADRRWARTVAIPAVDSLMREGQFYQAYHLATRARTSLPDDPTVNSLREASSITVNVITDPPGATVAYRQYSATDTTWHRAGVSPLRGVRLPYGYLRLRLELDGYRSLELAATPSQGDMNARMTPVDRSGDMVWISSGAYTYGDAPILLDSFLLDRHEVTNAEYQEFVDGGGYRTSDYWPSTFSLDGQTVSWDVAIEQFVDATGRPGPATWELSRYPEGRAQFPVGGVSWYEAVTYCAFVDKNLPTYYHWRHGAGFDVWDDILAHSNFAGEPTPVLSNNGVGPYGTHDMAGNVREWVWNGTSGLRYTLGGASNEPEYLFLEPNAASPWSRDAQSGFRCAEYLSEPTPDKLDSIDRPYFDFNTMEPVDDAAFAIYRSFYDYDPVDLGAHREVVDTTDDWIKEKVNFIAAYGDERVSAYIFLPNNVAPPYQTVVYFPGTVAFRLRSSENLTEMAWVNFIPRSGRALVYPVLKGSYERYLETPPRGPTAFRQRAVWWTQDVQRTVDYIMSRDDMRNDAVAYMGLSLGAEIAMPVALEKRFAALVLIGGAFDAQWRGSVLPEASPWNFASRITTPTVLINGRHDFQHPYETGQVPFFNALNVPPADKRFVVLDAGHIPPWNDVIKHSLDWLDRRLGPVEHERVDGNQ